MKPLSFKSGFSLVEMLIYVALLVLILMSVVNIVFSFSKSYEQLVALRVAEHTGLTSMERMIRDIHGGTSVDTAESIFNVSPGALTIVTLATTTKFYVVDGELRVDVNGEYIGPLSSSAAKLSSLVFQLIETDNSQAVRIEMVVEGIQGSVVRSKTYITTAILKNS